jgi:hypothetical protein
MKKKQTDMVKILIGEGPLTHQQLAEVVRWAAKVPEDSGIDGNAMSLIRRLVATIQKHSASSLESVRKLTMERNALLTAQPERSSNMATRKWSTLRDKMTPERKARVDEAVRHELLALDLPDCAEQRRVCRTRSKTKKR